MSIDILLEWSGQLDDEPTLDLPVLNNPKFTTDDREALVLVQQRVDAAAAQSLSNFATSNAPTDAVTDRTSTTDRSHLRRRLTPATLRSSERQRGQTSAVNECNVTTNRTTGRI